MEKFLIERIIKEVLDASDSDLFTYYDRSYIIKEIKDALDKTVPVKVREKHNDTVNTAYAICSCGYDTVDLDYVYCPNCGQKLDFDVEIFDILDFISDIEDEELEAIKSRIDNPPFKWNDSKMDSTIYDNSYHLFITGEYGDKLKTLVKLLSAVFNIKFDYRTCCGRGDVCISNDDAEKYHNINFKFDMAAYFKHADISI